MTTEPTLTEQENQKFEMMHHGPHGPHGHHGHREFHGPQGGGSGNIYGIGLIGAWAYYFKGVTNVKQGIEAFLKGLVWPAYLVYDLLVFLNKDKSPK